MTGGIGLPPDIPYYDGLVTVNARYGGKVTIPDEPFSSPLQFGAHGLEAAMFHRCRTLSFGPRSLLLLAALVLPCAGCGGSIAGMVVKHVAVSAAKNVAKSQYEELKRRRAEEKAARDQASRRNDGQSDELSPDNSETGTAP